MHPGMQGSSNSFKELFKQGQRKKNCVFSKYTPAIHLMSPIGWLTAVQAAHKEIYEAKNVGSKTPQRTVAV